MTRAALAVCLVALVAQARPKQPEPGSTSHSQVQDIVDALVRGEGNPNALLARARGIGAEAQVVARLDEISRTATDSERLRNIATALSMIGGKSGETALLRLLSSEDPATRMYAAMGLGRMKSQAAGPRLLVLLQDKMPGVRREAARGVGRLGLAGSGAALMKAAREETETEARAAMLIAVGQVRDLKQAGALATFLEAPAESARRAAARALCALGQPSGPAYAKKLLASEDRYDRLAGVELFSDAKPADATPVLKPLVEGSELQLSAAAARTLYQLGDAKMLTWLVTKSEQASVDDRLVYERELEALGITAEQRAQARQ